MRIKVDLKNYKGGYSDNLSCVKIKHKEDNNFCNTVEDDEIIPEVDNETEIVLKREHIVKLSSLQGYIRGLDSSCTNYFKVEICTIPKSGMPTKERIAKERILGLDIYRIKLDDDLYIEQTPDGERLISSKRIVVVDGRSLFYGLRAQELDIRDVDFSRVVDGKDMFGHTIINELNLSNKEFTHLKNVKNMFIGSTIVNLDMQGLKLDTIRSTKDMFNGCDIENLNVDRIYIPKLVSLERMFMGSKVGELNINIDTSNVYNMASMFESATIRGDLNGIEQFNTNKVLSMMRMFKDFHGSGYLSLNGFNTINVENMREMFAEASSSRTIDISSFSTTDIQDRTDMFLETGLNSFIISSEVLRNENEEAHRVIKY